MKNLTSMLAVCLLLVPAITYAQDEYKYQPVPNKAEYYVDKFKPGKDFEDLLKWGDQLVKWTSKHSIYDNWQPVVFMPYFNSNSQALDSVFLGIWPNATEQYVGLIIGSKIGAELLKKAPTTPVQAIDTWQWPISSPEGDMEVGAVRFSDCKMKDAIYVDKCLMHTKILIYPNLKGDNLGRKMIFPGSGATEGDYDYVYSLYARTVAELGAGYK